MASLRHRKDFFDPLDLEIMQRALAAACDMVKAYQPINDAHGANELRSFIGEKLVAIAKVHGVSDPVTLSALVLTEIPSFTALPHSPSPKY